MENKKKIDDEKAALRQIIIETDGNRINIAKAEVAGSIELIATLQAVISFLSQQKKWIIQVIISRKKYGFIH